MTRSERGYSLAEMMIGLFAFSMILGSIIFLITRWQQTTSITRIQRTLAMEARQAMQLVMKDVREASYIYHWTELDVQVGSDAIPGHNVFNPYPVTTGYTSQNGKHAIPALTTYTFSAAADLAPVANDSLNFGTYGLGEEDLSLRLKGEARERCSTLALVSLSEGGLARPTYIVYFTVQDNADVDLVNHVYRFEFQPTVDAPADSWHPMNQTFAEQQPATRSLIIKTTSASGGTIRQMEGAGLEIDGRWQIRKLFSTVNVPPSDKFADGLFYIRQLHPWSDETPISPMLVETTLVPAKRYGGRIVSFPLFDRAYAQNVTLPSAK